MSPNLSTKLELRIPPLLLVCIWAFLMWIVSGPTQVMSFAFTYKFVVASALFLSGIFVAVSGVVTFRRAGTTVNPTTPDKSCSLVTHGIYRLTRNPMYLGFLLILAGWGFYLSNPISLACLPGFVIYMNRYQIIPEERVLRSTFEHEFESYCERTRRWI